jgi:hypothetical protein
MGCGGIIDAVTAVLRKADWVRHLVRYLVDGDRDPDVIQEIDYSTIKVGNCLWF